MRILIIHASAGAGHQKAAEAIYDGIKNRGVHDAVLVDALDYTNKFYKNLYRKTYSLLIAKAPWAWGFFFWLAGVKFLLRLVQFIRRFFNYINAKRLHVFLKKEQFDYIFSTHFFPNEVAGYLKRNKLINSKIICAVTDYDVHSIWLAKGIDSYAVACEYTKEKIISLGVPQEHVFITGIPVNEKFVNAIDAEAVRKTIGIESNKMTVLVATGSFGIGPIEQIAEQLKQQQVLVVCGHNKSLFKKLSRKKREHVKVFGLVDNMYELMAVSDVMITKPGGLSITEALTMGLPLIFFSAIPGQETNNIEVLRKYNIGICSKDTNEIAKEIQTLTDSCDYFTTAKQNIKKLSRPSAVNDIVTLIK